MLPHFVAWTSPILVCYRMSFRRRATDAGAQPAVELLENFSRMTLKAKTRNNVVQQEKKYADRLQETLESTIAIETAQVIGRTKVQMAKEFQKKHELNWG